MIGLFQRGLLILAALLVVAYGQTCRTHAIRTAPPDNISGHEVALQNYSYCEGTLNTTVYIANVTTSRQVIYLWYTNRNNESTPLDGVSLSLLSAVGSDGEWEIWGASTPVAVTGITELLNLTYSAGGIGKTYHQVLNIPIDGGTGPAPAPTSPPPPYATPRGFGQDITEYLAPQSGSEAAIALAGLFLNIDPAIPGAAKGIAVAARSGPSFSQKQPNYEYTWVRDTSLAMEVVQKLYCAASIPSVKAKYENVLFQYAAARAIEQNDNLTSGLGQSRFYVNDTTWPDPRPQNDGPATAASVLIEFGQSYLESGGDLGTVLKKLWGSSEPGNVAPLKRDLLYTAANWSVPTVDIWEGVVGDHFYTRMVQCRALIQGRTFAQRINDHETAQVLSTAADTCTKSLTPFWDPLRQTILYEYGPVLRNESSYLDVATMLGIIHGSTESGLYSFTSDKVLATAVRVATQWIDIFPIANVTRNAQGGILGIPIGRFPEDMYNGTATGPGNPWYMATATYAQFMYSVVSEYTSSGEICATNVSKPFFEYFAPEAGIQTGSKYRKGSEVFEQTLASLIGWGDAFMRRIQFYTPADGHLTEEYDRNTGEAVGVADLTWSYASVLTAAFARAQISGQHDYTTKLADIGFIENR